MLFIHILRSDYNRTRTIAFNLTIYAVRRFVITVTDRRVRLVCLCLFTLCKLTAQTKLLPSSLYREKKTTYKDCFQVGTQRVN